MRVATILTALTAIALFDVIFARRHTPAWKRENDHHHRRHSYVLAFISYVHPEGVTFSLLVPMDTMVPHWVMVSIMVVPMIISRPYRIISTVANLKSREESKMEGFPFMKLVLVLVAPLILEMNLWVDSYLFFYYSHWDADFWMNRASQIVALNAAVCFFVFVSEDELGKTYWVLCLFILPYSNSTWAVIVSRRLLSR